MKLTLVISSLERGGAERILSVLASAWAARGNEVTLIVFDNRESPAYPLHPAVVLRTTGVPNTAARNPFHALHRNVGRIRILRRLIRQTQPELVISFLDFPNIITLLATRGLSVPVIVSERTNPQYWKLKPVWSFLRRKLYPCAAALVCPTAAMGALLEREIKVAGYVIPNPVELPSANLGKPKVSNTASRMIIAMGRLAQEKGFDLLLEAYARVSALHPSWSLMILGTGPMLGELATQVESLGLQNRVTFVESTSDPFSMLHAADLFVLSSRFEGFPNALAEAMACGLPVISFDCPTGPAEIIRGGVDGILVPAEDIAGLAAAMDNLMRNATTREELARHAPEVLARFSLQKVMALWEKLFATILPAKSEHEI